MQLVVLISGNGSNLQALIDAQFPIALVISNKKDAFGLERARKAGIPTLTKTLKSYKDLGKSRIEYDIDLAKDINGFLKGEKCLQVLAGFMHILSAEYLSHFAPGSMINLHPALPGAFDGARAIERAFEAYQQGQIAHTGVMVHKVIPQVDRGDVVLQQQVPIHPSDTLKDLEQRIHDVEHTLLVAGVRKMLTELNKSS